MTALREKSQRILENLGNVQRKIHELEEQIMKLLQNNHNPQSKGQLVKLRARTAKLEIEERRLKKALERY